MQSEIDYSKLFDDAMYTIVRKVLIIAMEQGLPGDNHFFISFITGYPGVIMSQKLLAKYPNEMTIVLQHQFQDLIVCDDYFSVKLQFGSITEQLVIPFRAIEIFADPSVAFSLQFKHHQTLNISSDNKYDDHKKEESNLQNVKETSNNIYNLSSKERESVKVISFADYSKRHKKNK